MDLKLSSFSPLVNALHSAIPSRNQRRDVAVPGRFLNWLGIAEKKLNVACQSLGIRCDSYVSPRSQKDVDASNDCCELPASLNEAYLYTRCVASDSLPSELASLPTESNTQWRALLASEYARCLSTFQSKPPQLVIALQGFEPHNAVARAVAHELQIPVLALENTAVATRMIWDRISGITTNRNAAKSFYWRDQDRVQASDCHSYCEQLIANTKQLKSDEHSSPQVKKQFSSDRPTVLFLGQVYTDASLIFGLRQWASPLDVLQQCVDWCQRQGYGLVVKLHPKESSGVNTVDNRAYDRLTLRKIQNHPTLVDRLSQLDAIIDQDNEFDTYDLIDRCELAVTVNSQAGLEAAIRGKPVVCCGDAFYAGLDFTCDAPAPCYFSVAMDQARQAYSPDQCNIARKFAYIFFERYCREKNVQSLAKLIEESLA